MQAGVGLPQGMPGSTHEPPEGRCGPWRDSSTSSSEPTPAEPCAASDNGSEVVLFGWVQNRRDHGGCIFIDLRDREGVDAGGLRPRARAARPAPSAGRPGALASGCSACAARCARAAATRNPKLPTGEIEVVVVEATVFNKAETPPFEIADNIDTREEKRLEYRYLDLRRPSCRRTCSRAASSTRPRAATSRTRRSSSSRRRSW